MKKINQNRKTFLFTSLMIMAAVWGFLLVQKKTNIFQGLDLIIFILIVIVSVIAFVRAIKIDKDEKEGLPAEDELSNQIKYKAGYHAYMASMYMWLFIFLLKDKFPDVETMLGGGILLSALIAFVSRVIVKRRFYEKQN